MQTTFSTMFILRSSRMRNGLSPIYCRVTVDGQRAEFSIKKSIDEAKWAIGKVKGNSEEAKSVNCYLKQVESTLFEHYREFVANKKLVTADALKKAYLGITDEQYSLLGLIDYHNTQLKGTIEWGTMKNFMTTQRYVQEFLKAKLKVTDIFLRNLSYKFVADYEYFLRSYVPLDHHKKMGNNTV